MSTFNIVTQPDWEQHDQQHRAQAKDRLKATAPATRQRNLEQAATRFQAPDGLLDAINAAIVTRSPLLLTGEPGTGKTQVAWFLKRYFDIELFEYQVRSDSQSADLRYDFDAVAYLRDAYQTQYQAVKNHEHPENSGDPEAETQSGQDGLSPADPRSDKKYLKPGALWKAYQHDDECVLLLDEIDKAPRDFPNDVLQELDQHRFAHPFHEGEFVECQGSAPLIIITSNAERRLPDAFLRRCIVFHIALDEELLRKIMQAWEQQFPDLASPLREQALKRFMEIRNKHNLSKKPGAAEFLLWLGVLSAQRVSLDELQTAKLSDLPALICLIKEQDDYGYL